jgi:hypothetical protein
MTALAWPTNDRRWLPCRNVDVRDVNSYSVVEIVNVTQADDRFVLEVKPGQLLSPLFHAVAAAGPTRIAPGEFGHCSMQWPAWLAVHEGPDSNVGDILGLDNAHDGRLDQFGQGFLLHSKPTGDPPRVLASFGGQYFRSKKMRFRLTGNPLEKNQSLDATASAVDRWDGHKRPFNDHFTLANLPISEGYMFWGDREHVGLATFDDVRDRYLIITMECP